MARKPPGHRRNAPELDSLRSQRIREPPVVQSQPSAVLVTQSKPERNIGPELVDALRDRIETVALGRPTLEDVFIKRTGHRFWSEDE